MGALSEPTELGVAVLLTITVQGERSEAGGAPVHDLSAWLGRQRDLRGVITRAGAAPRPGAMGASTDVLTALLVPGGVATVLASAVVAWVRSRTGKQTVTFTRPDGAQLTVTTEGVKDLSAAQVSALVRDLAATLDVRQVTADGPQPEPREE
ncbi:hypothetical protein [Streptomyces sp. NPDC046985]|uniref:effector-associated constant component EACC1 n=1 Tax=Streptomyces sp. NPDC046985 TaxID=3155377 RepID=UPI0033F5EBBB